MVNKADKAKKETLYSYDLEVTEKKFKFFPWITYDKKVLFHRRKLRKNAGMNLIVPEGWTKEEVIHE